MFTSLVGRRCAIAACIFSATPLSAATSDSEFWIELGAQGQISDNAELKLEVEQRRREGADEYILGAAVDVEVASNLELGGGLELHDQGGFTEIRPYQQLTFAAGPLSFRSRIEERFFDEAEQVSLRLRQRVQFTQSLGPRTRALASAELLYQLQDRTEGGSQRIDQWRFIAGVRHRVAERLDLTGGYLFQIRPRPDGATRHTHVPQLYVTYRF